MKTAILFLLSLSVGGFLIDEAAAQQPFTTKSDVDRTNEAKPATNGDLDSQIADTLYKLTRARLQRVGRINARVPGTVSADDVAIIGGELKAISHQQETHGVRVDWFSSLLGIAEVTKASADADWKRVAAQQYDPQSNSDPNIAVVRLRAQLADLSLQRGRLAATGTADDRQNWALLYLSMQVQELRDRVRVAEERD